MSNIKRRRIDARVLIGGGGGTGAEGDFFGVVVGNAVDEEKEWIDAGLVGEFAGDEGVSGVRLGDVNAFAVESFAVFAIFFGLGEGADIDPVVYRDFGFVALGIGFEFVRFNIDGDVELAVGALSARWHRACGWRRA